jgi:chromate reductase, NAD(P)H dehydrogenase (quinone)
MAYNVAIVAGSLRKDAFSTKIAKALIKLAPASLRAELVTLESLSFFNQDLEAAPPADWVVFRDKIRSFDGVIFVTPEHNRSITSALKNAIDIGSRPYGQSVFQGKAIGIVGTSPGAHGGVSAVKHLQQILPGISGPILQQPEMYLGGLGDAFENGDLTKDSVKDFLQKYLAAYEAWVSLHAGAANKKAA